MGLGFGKLKRAAKKAAKAAAKKAAQQALPLATDLVPGGGAIKLAGGIARSALAGDKKQRLAQVGAALATTKAKGNLKEFAELAEDAWRLGEVVKEARADEVVTPDEVEAILELVEELSESAARAMHNIVKV